MNALYVGNQGSYRATNYLLCLIFIQVSRLTCIPIVREISLTVGQLIEF